MDNRDPLVSSKLMFNDRYDRGMVKCVCVSYHYGGYMIKLINKQTNKQTNKLTHKQYYDIQLNPIQSNSIQSNPIKYNTISNLNTNTTQTRYNTKHNPIHKHCHTFLSAWHLLNDSDADHKGAKMGDSKFIAALGNKFLTNPL